ncbi:PREDICTED: uncharacterized protein LOC106811561 [Priapulus caudatus]|uniref:Uncharacterized protein LOC106811561 n=1 Tax=Priapulus caudatus TaxID=37621 RepID=A0ABM1EEU6_PRICU|nr:PREDICTED: uncharacterized protein LOC106811561 [Priapulus caudatus]
MASGLRSDVKGDDVARYKGYLKNLKAAKFILYCNMYLDIVCKLAILSKSLQGDEKSVPRVLLYIETALDEIKELTATDGPNLNKCRSEGDGDVEFDGVAFENDRCVIIDAIVHAINLRFDNFVNSDLIKAMSFIDPSNWPDDSETLKDYGNDDIDRLVDHFRVPLETNNCDTSVIQSEWRRLKKDIRRHHSELKCHKLWQTVIVNKAEQYSNILHIVRIVLTIPISTAHVERVFSYVKRILGDWRHRMNVKTMEDLVRISLEGVPLRDFDPFPVVKQWQASGCRKRRPYIAAYGPTRKATTTAVESCESSGDSGDSASDGE